MSVILVDQADEKHDIQINHFNWRPALELIKDSGAGIDKQRLEVMSTNLGAEVSEEEARAIAMYLAESVLKTLQPGEKIHLDKFTSTQELLQTSKDKSSNDSQKEYGVTYEVLQKLVEFLNTCGGFKVY